MSQEPEEKKRKLDVDESVQEMSKDVPNVVADQIDQIKKAPASTASAPKIDKIMPKPVSSNWQGPDSKSESTKKKGKYRVDSEDETEGIDKTEDVVSDAGDEKQEEEEEAEEEEMNEVVDKKEMNEASKKLAASFSGTLKQVSDSQSNWKKGAP